MVEQCLRCGYGWIPRNDSPKQCPKCKQYYYNRPAGWEYLPEYKDAKKVIRLTEQPKDKIANPFLDKDNFVNPLTDEIKTSETFSNVVEEIKKERKKITLD